MSQTVKTRKAILRDWLEELLDADRIPALKWYNKDAGVFFMIWRNGNNSAWTEDDGELYKAWAIHKEHYKPNPDGTWPESDYTTWKSRFRCALTRCPSVHEIKQAKNYSGEKKSELKMFSFSARDKRSTQTGSSQDHQAGCSNNEALGQVAVQPSCSTDAYMNVVFPPCIPEVIAGLKVTPPSSLETEAKAADGNHTFNSTNPGALMDLSSERLASYADELMDASINYSIEIGCEGQQEEMPDSLSLLSFKYEPKVHEMCLWLRYRSTVIGKYLITEDQGCRIYNARAVNIPAPPKEYNFGRNIGLPDPQVYLHGVENQQHCKDIDLLLGHMDNGLHFYSDAYGNIFVKRFSRCKIFCANSSMNATEPYKLPRPEVIPVFNYAQFQQQLEDAKMNDGRAPSVSVMFSLGQQWSWTKSINKMCISATLTNAKCWYDLRKYLSSRRTFQGKAVEDTPIEVSFENMTIM